MRIIELKKRDEVQPSRLRQIALILAGIALSMVIPALIMIWLQRDPSETLIILVTGAFGSPAAIGKTMLKTAPLLTAALGVVIAFRAGLWNIGNLGQYMIGALGGVLAALAIGDRPGAWIIALLAGALGGALWALIPGILRSFWSINEVVTTLMMNYIAVLLIDYLVTQPLKDVSSGLSQTARIAVSAQMPRLMEGSRVHLGLVIALLLAIGVYVLIFHTSLGYELRVVGKSNSAAEYGGISVKKTLIIAMLLSGSLSGLAGAGEVLALYQRLLNGIAGGYEYTPIIVALLGDLHPLGIIIPAVLFGGLLVGAQTMQVQIGLSAAFMTAIQALIVLFVGGVKVFNQYRIEWNCQSKVLERSDAIQPPQSTLSQKQADALRNENE